jgi:uncharacterized membrane-anchored protein
VIRVICVSAASIAIAIAIAAGFPGAPSAAEEPQVVQIQWQRGPMTAPIGDDLAEIDIGEDAIYLDAEGTRRLMELTQNPLSGREVATLSSASEDEGWFLVLEFDAVGYVPDEEKNDLDADAILESIRAGTEAANETRRKRGWSTLSIVGWQEAPHYDERTNHLSWAVIGESEGRRTINRIVKLLGRHGVMTATLVASPDELVSAIPAADTLLANYRFRPGNTYAEFVPGTDKLAQYGLTALVVGGAGAALVKSGLLARLWKPIVVGLAALGASLKRFFLSGRSARHDPEAPIA